MLRSPLSSPRSLPSLHQIPLRLILVVPFVLQVSIAVGLTGWLSVRNGQQAVNDLAGQLRHETTQQVDYQISDFLTTAETLQELILKAIQRDQIDLANIRSLEDLYWSYLTSFDTVSGLGAGNAAGDIMALFQQIDTHETQYFFEYSDATTSGQYISTLLHSQQEVIRATAFDQQVDARTRPWYRTALTAEAAVWTEVYPSISKSSEQALLVNLSSAVRNGNGQVQGVVSVILDLRTISQFLENLDLSPSGQVYILQPDGNLVGSSDGQNPLNGMDERLMQRPATRSRTPLIRASAAHLRQQVANLGDIRQSRQFEFWLDGQRQFLQVTPLSPESGLNWLIVVVMPESDFMAQIQANTRHTILLCLGALGMAIALGLVTSRWITAPLLRLSKAAGAIATGNLDQMVEGCGSREIRDLAGAFNHMARQLQTLFLELQTSERRYRQVVESQTDFILRSRPDTTITFANEALCAALGCPLEAVVGQKWIDFAHPDDLDLTLQRIGSMTPEHPIFLAENRDARANGEMGWTQWINQGIFNEKGKLIEIQSVGRDITALKQAEAALRESEERFRRAVTEAPFPIVIHAEDGEILQVNQTWVELTGYTLEAIPTIADWTERAYGERQEVVKAGIDRLYSLDARLDEGEFQIRTRTGEIRIWDFSSTPLGPMSDGRRLVMSIAADVTQRQQAEAALQRANLELEQRVAYRTAQLRATNSRLSLALRAANAGTWEWDMATNRTFWSEENYRLLGYAPGSCESNYENWLRAVYPGDREWVHTHILRVVEQRCSLDLEYRVLLSDGQIRWIADFGELIYDPQGQPRSMAGIQVDITQRKQAEEQLCLSSERISLANAELSRAARLKDEFLAGMSHELRTPLNSVLGLSEALLDQTFGELNEQQQEFLQIIQQSGRHLLELINDILDLSKVQSGKMDLQIAAVPTRDICDLSLSFVKQQARQKHIALTCDITDEILEIEVDERRIRQVLINLLSNAVKFTPDGGSVKLQVGLNALHEAVEFKVIDTGIGIAVEDMGQLFQPFVQLDSGLSRRYEGTGLGLALVKQITELHGGSVSLESTVGQGSCFTVALPLSVEHLKQPPSDRTIGGAIAKSGRPTKASPSPPTAPCSESSLPSLPPARRVLLAEDHEANIIMIGKYLRHHNMQVVIARSGLEAVDLSEQHPVDLILMDIQMPEMDGLAAIRKIRQMSAHAHTPIIALTALAMPGDRDRCLKAGATAYLTKPISLKHLTTLIETSVARIHAD